MPTLDEIKQEFDGKFETLNSRFEEKSEELEAASGDNEKVEAVSKAIADIQDEVKELTVERDQRIKDAEFDSVKGEVVELRKALEDARKPGETFQLPGVTEEETNPFGTDTSFYATARKACFTNDKAALELWEEAMASKAMTEASGTTGGYLVPPQVSTELIQLREQSNILRPLFSRVQVSADVYRIAAQTSGLTAAWVAELAEKPKSELGFGEISVNVFTKAGMAVVSNQLLQDSNPSIDGLINRDLAKRLAALEEIAMISGSGNGQPKGILNTEGVQTTNFSAAWSVDALLDNIIDAITSIYTNYFGAPNAIVMHPRTWGQIVKARNPDFGAQFLIGPPHGGREGTDRLPGFGSGANPTGLLFGLPVYTTRNVPINRGANDDESRVIVGAFDEGLILDHSDVTLDSSPHVYFTSNQTVFRAEDRVGFTAARYPEAFNVIGGTGLAGK